MWGTHVVVPAGRLWECGWCAVELEKPGRPQGVSSAPPSMRCCFKHAYHDRHNGYDHPNSNNLEHQHARDQTCRRTCLQWSSKLTRIGRYCRRRPIWSVARYYACPELEDQSHHCRCRYQGERQSACCSLCSIGSIRFPPCRHHRRRPQGWSFAPWRLLASSRHYFPSRYGKRARRLQICHGGPAPGPVGTSDHQALRKLPQYGDSVGS